MDNPFENISGEQKPKVKRTFKLGQMLSFFPEESQNSVSLKMEIAKRIQAKYPSMDDMKIFLRTQMFFNKYFYRLDFSDEKKIDEVLDIEFFEMFKTI